jgi:hypothetical protein
VITTTDLAHVPGARGRGVERVAIADGDPARPAPASGRAMRRAGPRPVAPRSTR